MQTREQSIEAFFCLQQPTSGTNEKKVSGLYKKDHSSLPLTIFTYGKLHILKTMQEIDACRGLVVEKETMTIVSRGFDRFLPRYPALDERLVIHRATVKEDGSLLFLWKYQGHWYVSTMHDFAENKVEFGDFSYSELFSQIIDEPLDEFAENLLAQFDGTKRVMTFCFEMCSPFNRIIRPYPIPTLFLIAAFGGENGNHEIPVPESISFRSSNVHLISEVIFPKALSFGEAIDRVKEICRDEFTFEGIVLQTDQGRIKVKNPYYKAQHTLKYRGWVKGTAQLLIPLLLEQEDPTILEKIVGNVLTCVNGDPLFHAEIKKRISHYSQFIEEEWMKVKVVVDHLSEDRRQWKDRGEFVREIKNKFSSEKYFDRWGNLFLELFQRYRESESTISLQDLLGRSLFARHFLSSLDKLCAPGSVDPFLDASHPPRCCQLTEENLPNLLQQIQLACADRNDGLSQSREQCYCGQEMRIKRLRRDITRSRYCHCGAAYGYLTYPSGSWLGTCSDPACLCTHEVHQKTQESMGRPASFLCKTLRLSIHELIDRRRGQLSKDQCYAIVSSIVGKSREETHMALFGVSECIEVLLRFDQAADKLLST